ncbi:MAG: tRNA (uridine(54)-C5)-methyltransferase TrmA [Cardiobacteriaceae bacterium]|nr:tRNA (uridine(54)-C5)-methyltransferase TrmA [Cardiobacteriaceae bacterium]
MTMYAQQLEEKAARLSALLAPFAAPEMEVFPSPPEGYRLRAEFRLWHDEAGVDYVMVAPGERASPETVRKIRTLPIASAAINALMPRLREALNGDEILRRKIFQCEFLSTLQGDMLVTLVYHRRLDEAWQRRAAALAAELGVALIGRSRGQKIVLEREFVEETLTVAGRDWHYRQYEGAFTQPNGRMCEAMLAWACAQAGDDTRDLLELYAGNGNFTLPLSQHFRKVLATEISKSGIRALRENVAMNGVDNIRLARLSAEEFSAAWRGEREFQRLKQDGITLADYDFSTIFVDPPRAGIDAATLAMMQRFARIIYISCNPATLADNLKTLTQTHRISACALFDQFPGTEHIESGVVLQRKNRLFSHEDSGCCARNYYHAFKT